MTRNYLIGGIIGLVLLGLGGYGLWYSQAIKTDGLVTFKEIELDEATRNYFTQRLAVDQAAIEAAKQSGAELDLDLYLAVASDAYALGDLVTARTALEVQLEGNALNYSAWNFYGTVLEDMTDYDGAKDAYKKAIDSQAAIEEFYRDYINLLVAHFPGSAQEVKSILELSIKERGQTSWNMVELGDWYKEAGDCSQAIEHYTVAASLTPGSQAIKDDLATLRQGCK